MRFIVNSTEFLKALENVQGIVDKRNTLPILANVRVIAKDTSLTVNATDMDIDIIENMHADILSPGETTANAYILYETTKRLPANKDVEISLEGSMLHIKCAKFKGNISTMGVEDFPIISASDLDNNFKIEKSDLKQLLEKTRSFVSTDEARYYLNGIYLHTVKNAQNVKVLRSVATDGHRLALCDVLVEDTFNLDSGIVIPKKTIDIINKLLDKVSDKELEILCSKTRISFRFSNITLTSKLIDANFPAYTKVIPYENEYKLEIPRLQFVEAINLLGAYGEDKQKSITLDIKDDVIKINAYNTISKAEAEINLVNPAIEPLNIAFNPQYVLEVCNLIKTENIVVMLSNKATPALIKAQDSDDEIYVVMPMRM